MLTRTFLPAVFRNDTRAWDPFRELRNIQEEMNELFDRGWYSRSAEYPPVNVWNSEDETIVQAELPGFTPEEIDISLVQNTLTLRGSRKPEALKEGENYHRRERWTGQFVRTLELPYDIDAGKVEAQFEHGVLSIRLPRVEEQKPKKIAVKAS
jgi:HSP20 family protein